MDHFAPLSVRGVIALWPSSTALAADIGEKPETARQWAKRGSIPVRYWPALIVAAAARNISGVTAESLMRLHVPEAPLPTPANDTTPTPSEDAA